MTDQPKDPAAVSLGRRGGQANKGVPKPHAIANLKGARGGRERGPSAEALRWAAELMREQAARLNAVGQPASDTLACAAYLDKKAKRRAEGKGI